MIRNKYHHFLAQDRFVSPPLPDYIKLDGKPRPSVAPRGDRASDCSLPLSGGFSPSPRPPRKTPGLSTPQAAACNPPPAGGLKALSDDRTKAPATIASILTFSFLPLLAQWTSFDQTGQDPGPQRSASTEANAAVCSRSGRSGSCGGLEPGLGAHQAVSLGTIGSPTAAHRHRRVRRGETGRSSWSETIRGRHAPYSSRAFNPISP